MVKPQQLVFPFNWNKDWLKPALKSFLVSIMLRRRGGWIAWPLTFCVTCFILGDKLFLSVFSQWKFKELGRREIVKANPFSREKKKKKKP